LGVKISPSAYPWRLFVLIHFVLQIRLKDGGAAVPKIQCLSLFSDYITIYSAQNGIETPFAMNRNPEFNFWLCLGT
jgi:hypothetical protein